MNDFEYKGFVINFFSHPSLNNRYFIYSKDELIGFIGGAKTIKKCKLLINKWEEMKNQQADQKGSLLANHR